MSYFSRAVFHPALKSTHSNLLHRGVGAWWESDGDRVLGSCVAAGHHHAHHSGSTDLFAGAAVAFAVDEHHLEHAVAHVTYLWAWVSKTCQRHQNIVADSKHRPDWEADEVESRRGDVLSELARANLVARFSNFLEQLRHHQMHLAQVRLVRVSSDPGSVLHRRPEVGIANHSEAGFESDRCLRILRELVRRGSMHGHHRAR